MSVQAAINAPVEDVLTGLELRMLNKAMHDLVHSHKNGAAGLGPLIEKAGTTLSHEVNPNSDKHKLGLVDAVRLLKITESSVLLQQICQVLGYTLVPIRKFEGCSDIEVLTMYAKWHKEIGDVGQEVSAAFLDHKLTYREYANILREGIEANAAFHAFLSRLEALLDKGDER